MVLNHKRFKFIWLIFGIFVPVTIWLTFHTDTTGVINHKYYGRLISRKEPIETNSTLPLRVHIYDKRATYFPDNLFAGCNSRCYETSGKNDYVSSKYVFFLEPMLGKWLPGKFEDQVWIFFTQESPHYHGTKNFKFWKNFVNLTMSFRRDSDIFIGFGGFRKRTFGKRPIKNTSYEQTNPKFSLPLKMSWMVSNCNTPGKRRKYVDLILKEPNVTVDIYGKCGAHKCPKNQKISCMNLVDSKYPYYLSFENSLCVDYISEKTYKIYQHNLNTIPVARGDVKSYEKLIPKNSYMNVNHFKSVSQLVQAQKNILKSKDIFNSFFNWRNHFESWEPDYFCRLCEFLIDFDITGKRKYYEKFDLWLNGYKERPICRDPIDV